MTHPDIVQYRPGQIASATATLTGQLNTMRQQADDRIHAGTQYVHSGAGQFTEQFQAKNEQYRAAKTEYEETVHKIINAVNEATAQNAARDARSASSIGG